MCDLDELKYIHMPYRYHLATMHKMYVYMYLVCYIRCGHKFTHVN